MSEKIKCMECGGSFQRITNTHLNAKHSMTMQDYKNKYPDAPIDSPELKERRAENVTGGYEENPELIETRRRDALEQMQDENQIEIREEQCGYDWSDEQRKEMSERKTKHGRENYRIRALEEYGKECQHCGTSEENLVVHHKNGNKYDNRIENLAVLCNSCHTSLHNKLRKEQEYFMGKDGISTAVSDILNALNIDQSHPDYRNTPNRVARSFYETCERCFVDDSERLDSILGTTFPAEHDSLVIQEPIRAYSMCPHHLKDIIYDIYFGYIPNDEVVGLSKVPRFIKYLAKKPELQETYTEEIVDTFMKYVNPKSCMVVVKGVHHCMKTRGIKSYDPETTTSAVRGLAKDSPEVRQEFFDAINI